MAGLAASTGYSAHRPKDAANDCTNDDDDEANWISATITSANHKSKSDLIAIGLIWLDLRWVSDGVPPEFATAAELTIASKFSACLADTHIIGRFRLARLPGDVVREAE